MFEKKEGGKRTLSTKSVSSEEGDEASGGDKGRVGGKRTKSVSSEEVGETSGGDEGREGGERTLSTKSVSSEEGVEET